MRQSDSRHYEPQPVQVVAEIGANHGGSVDVAHRMLEALAMQGCSLVKFQMYTANELIADMEREVQWGAAGSQVSQTIGEMFESIALPWSAFDEVFTHARELGMEPFGTPFSFAGLERLIELGVSRIKIASSDVAYWSLLEEAAKSGLPVILSVGKSTLAETDQAVLVLEGAGCEDLTLLHTIAAYPTPLDQANLRNITTLRTIYPDHKIGFSDHTQGIVAAIVAVSLGAEMVERHVTLSRNMGGPDDWFSLAIDEFGSLSQDLRDAQETLGTTRKRVMPAEEQGRKMGTRSLFLAEDLPAGTVLSDRHVVALRPRLGLHPGHEADVVGFSLCRDATKGEPITWDMFKP